MSAFSLFSHQVPSPPKSLAWVDILKLVVCVMDPDDTRLGFAAGCLSQAAKHSGLTEKQAKACQKIYERMLSDYRQQILVCQNNEPEDVSAVRIN